MKVHSAYLAGIGSYIPDLVTTEQAVKEGWYAAAERESSGMESVAVAGPHPAPDMAVQAARTALRRSGRSPDDFGALVHSDTYHQGPDGWSAPHYVLRNSLDRPVTALEVRLGCLGMLASLEVAIRRLADQETPDSVLLTTADNFSTPLVDRWRASALFLLADAGSSAVVSRRGGFARVLAIGSASSPQMEELHRSGEALFPPPVTVGRSLNFEERARHWRRQWAQGVTPPMAHFGMTIARVAEQTLAESGVPLAAIRRVCHVGFGRGPLLAMFFEPLGLELEQGAWEYTRRIGHTGAADLFVALEHLWLTGQVVPGDHVLMIAAATGMEAGCAVLEITAAPTAEDLAAS
jgi:3-oxoacyl-[acyl-carrier-protein] synthase III